jgi:hypothetical protein
LLRFHHIVHIHPNNATAVVARNGLEIAPIKEFTFLRKDRALLDQKATLRFPHPLDADNVPGNNHVRLPESWQ